MPYKMKIAFPGYERTGTLTNFPALVLLSEELPGFAYRQFTSPTGADLRFTDASEAQELNYEIEHWDTNGVSSVWVQVPVFSRTDYVWAGWGNTNAFQPDDLPGLRLWLRADAGVQTNGSGGVTNWTDQSGVGNSVSQSVASNRPAMVAASLNGRPVVRFQRAERDHLVRASPDLPSGASPRTLIVAARNLTAPGGAYPFACGENSSNRVFALDLSPDIRVVGFENDHDTGLDADTVPHLYAIVYDGTNVAPYADGAPGIASARTYHTTSTNLILGNFTFGEFHYDGDIAEVLMYDRALNAAELNRIGYHLGQKYAIPSTYVEGPVYTADGSTWSESYQAVLHLTGEDLADSSDNGFDGANAGSTDASGFIARARHFDKSSNQFINCGSGLDIANSDFTVSAWAKRGLTGAAAEGYLVSHGAAGPPDRMGLHAGFRGGGDADQFGFGFWGDDVNAPGVTTDTNGWHLWTTTYETGARTQKIYKDGTLVTTRTAADHYQGAPAADLRIGSRFDNVAFDGRLDEVRISSVERSSNWIWATYVNAASNAAFTAYGFIAGAPPPYVSNEGGATDVTPHTAWLNGSLLTTGQAPTTVFVYYGEEDAGTNPGAWDHFVSSGERGVGALAVGVSGLKADTTYYYRCYATNAFGGHWTAGAARFVTARAQLIPTKYAHRMKIQFDGYTKGETLTNFPLLVTLHEGLEDFRYSDFTSASGGDLRFTDADGTTELRFEVERWVTSGASHVWVQVPALASGGCIYAYWGRPGATVLPAFTTNGMAWSGAFRAVYHLHTNAAADLFLDSTAFGMTGTNSGTFDDTGLIGRGRDLNDFYNHHIRGGAGLDLSNKSFSVSVWSKRFSADYGSSDYLLSHGSPGTNAIGLHFGFVDPNTVRFSFWGDDLDHYHTNYANTTEWHLWTATFDAGTRRQTVYRDGVEMAWRTSSATYQGPTSTIFRLGGAFTDANSYYDGWMDEVRVADATRSSNWVWACYLSQKSNAVFSTYRPVHRPLAELPELDPAAFTHRMKICPDGYTRDETLTNFPLLVVFHPGVNNFSYSAFDSPEGADLRFTDASGTRELSYEIERWNTAGTSYVWARMPMLQTGACLYAYWGRPARAAPPDLGLKLWLDAGAGVQTNASGGVTNWVDQSGNGNDVAQSVAGRIPAFVSGALNGKPAVRFDGDDKLLKAAPSLPSGAAPRTILLVARSELGTGDLYPFSYGSAAANATMALDVGDEVRVVAFGNDHDTGIDGDGATHLYAIVYDGATVEPHVDGAPGAAGARVYDTTLSNLYVGAFADGGFGYDGDVLEVLVYDRTLSPAELNETGFYLERKYGLATGYREGPLHAADGSTWAQDYRTVLHLDHDVLDSSPLGLDTTNFGALAIAGAVSRGHQFNKLYSDHLQGGGGLDLVNRSFSLSAWVRRDASGSAADGFFLSHGISGVNNQGLHFGFRGGAEADTITFAFWGDDLNSHDATYADTSEWHLWTATYDALTRRQTIYRDGVSMATRIADANYQGAASTILRVGEFIGTSYHGGGLDELRIAAASRSSNWVWACWHNQRSNAAFSAYASAGRVDRDEDGLPDYWELLHFGDPTNAVPSAHDDDDTFDNGEEYIADTIPTDGDSCLHAKQIVWASPVRVFFDGSTSRVYTLQYSTNLLTGPWSEVPFQMDRPGFGADSFLTDTNRAGERAYRLGVEVP